jgi:hypothetical protein
VQHCSAALTFISFLKLSDSLTQRGHFEGWEDIDVLHSMHQDAKANINRVQKTQGLPITDLDQIALSHEAHERKKTET